LEFGLCVNLPRNVKLAAIPRLYRRAILIYLGTIVVPAVLLLYLGINTFELQRQNLARLKEAKLAADLRVQTLAAAESVFAGQRHVIAQHFFEIEQGVVTRPALRSGFRLDIPPEFQEAEHVELNLNQPDKAVTLYRKLAATHHQKALAWSRVARCLEKLGRQEEARETWRKIATTYPDDLDSSLRPYGIVAAIEAGDTAGLYEKIEAGRWGLPADQAEYFLNKLDSSRTSSYLARFDFARELEEQFKPKAALRENVTYESEFGRWRVFYRVDGRQKHQGILRKQRLDREHAASGSRSEIESRRGICSRIRLRRRDQPGHSGSVGRRFSFVEGCIARSSHQQVEVRFCQ
jgi:tetratricopeptide (TPR) repeat protein